MKTNAMRVLDSLSIRYDVLEYEWDEEHLDAVHASASLGVDAEKVFKTIVMKGGSGSLFVFSLPAFFEISRKKAKELARESEISLLPLSLLKKETGYVRGGCSPLAMTKKYPLFIEETALLEDEIYFSAGQRGMLLRTSPLDLQKASGGVFADFVQ